MRKLFYGRSILISFILWGFPCIFITFVSWQFSTSLSDSTCCVLQSKHIVVFEFLSHHHLSSKHNILNQCIKVLVSCFISQIMGNLHLRLNHPHTCKYCASQPGSACLVLIHLRQIKFVFINEGHIFAIATCRFVSSQALLCMFTVC